MALLATALTCLALNVFHESRGESIPGQYAVAQVTMNRAGSDPGKVCKVVYAPKQFSWTSFKTGNPAKIDPDSWKRAQIIAGVVLSQPLAMDLSRGATHYHAKRVRPDWRTEAHEVTVIGNHVFYRLNVSHH